MFGYQTIHYISLIVKVTTFCLLHFSLDVRSNQLLTENEKYLNKKDGFDKSGITWLDIQKDSLFKGYAIRKRH